ncbi:ATP-binding protein [Massilia sp. W12]|uniref:ATP-binding protein n=1 Tax=Massilia sp. W12 TaxID=3126507 RepID=UPI0030CBB899
MMRLAWLHSLRVRLLSLALLPLLLMFAAMLMYARQAQNSAAEQELQERAALASTALAESLGAPLRARDWRSMRVSLNAVLQADHSIALIEVFDLQNRLVLEVEGKSGRREALRSFRATIRDPAIYVTPLASSSNGQIAPQPSHIGILRVSFSNKWFVQRAQSRFQFDLAVTLLALGLSAALAWRMARNLTAPLQAAVRALRRLRQRDFEVELHEDGPGEIGELQASLNAMAASLCAATRELEATVEARTRDLLASRNEALQANEARRALLQRLHTIIEDERKGIALEIHDELNAVLIGVRLEAERILQLAQQLPPDDPAQQQISARAQAILQSARALYASARQLVRRLRPEMLEMLGLAGALEEMLRHWQDSACVFEISAQEVGELPEGIAISAYRIVQEACSNIVKHAQARHARIRLWRSPTALQISIEDDGCGFTPQAAKGFGLAGMRERVAAWHGAAELTTAPGQGCRWRFTLPLPDASAPAAAPQGTMPF